MQRRVEQPDGHWQAPSLPRRFQRSLFVGIGSSFLSAFAAIRFSVSERIISRTALQFGRLQRTCAPCGTIQSPRRRSPGRACESAGRVGVSADSARRSVLIGPLHHSWQSRRRQFRVAGWFRSLPSHALRSRGAIQRNACLCASTVLSVDRDLDRPFSLIAMISLAPATQQLAPADARPPPRGSCDSASAGQECLGDAVHSVDVFRARLVADKDHFFTRRRHAPPPLSAVKASLPTDGARGRIQTSCQQLSHLCPSSFDRSWATRVDVRSFGGNSQQRSLSRRSVFRLNHVARDLYRRSAGSFAGPRLQHVQLHHARP